MFGKAAFPPPDFVYFHCARKLAIFRSQRSTRSFLGFTHQVASRGVGPGPQALAQVWGRAAPSVPLLDQTN